MRTLRLGILQFGAVKDKGRNLDRIKSLIKPCEADLVILPEYSMYDIVGLNPKDLVGIAEPIDGPFINGLAEVAREYSTYLIAGIIEKEGGKVFNTAVTISPGGYVVSKYRKVHLFDAYGFRESDYFVAGDEPSPVIDLGKAKVATAICFDIRFPELFRRYALAGAELVAIPSAWFKGPLKEETLAFLARARAHENTVYIALSVQYSEHFTGRSMVVDPLGVVVADLGIGEKYVEVPIDMDYIDQVRKTLPVLKLRREEVYSRLPTSLTSGRTRTSTGLQDL